MKKFVALMLALLFVFAVVGCQAKTYEIALVTDVGDIDDKSFNQGTWEGVKAFAEENKISYEYYRPTENSTEARIETMKAAIEKGAKVVVCPGYLFEEAIYAIQGDYPEVNFLLLDGEPHDANYNYETNANVHCILYQEEQAGYFAGYAAVMDGYTKLGFLGGMDVPAVIRFGYGFVQGANAAATEKGVADQVSVKYWYSGTFSPEDAIKTKMAGWYSEGTEVVFACGGGIYLSCVAAAGEANNAKVIGVDVDQYAESDLIISSAMKELAESVKISLTDLYKAKTEDSFAWPEAYAGKTAVLGVEDNCVGLPTATTSWRFANYTVAEYEALFASVKNGTIVVSNATDAAPEVAIAVDYQN